MKNILFIGAGRMAQAMISGLQNHQQHSDWNITAANRADSRRLAEVGAKYAIHTTRNWQSAAESADVIVLAIPPGAHPEVLQALSLRIQSPLVVSVAAGIGVKVLSAALPQSVSAAWVMPNTAAEIGESMTLFACSPNTTDSHRRMLEVLLQGIGRSLECTEEQIQRLTAITGSAPAFLYRMAQVMKDFAMECGLPDAAAHAAIAQMFYGSGCMLQQRNIPSALEDDVTSPGGATAAGIQVLLASDFPTTLRKAIHATNARAAELAMNLHAVPPVQD